MDELDQPSGDLELAHRQALKYGQDLARVYVAEKAKREELEVAYQVLSAIFASTPDGLVVLDDQFNITQANTAFVQLVEMTVQELVGRAINDILLTDELLPALEYLAADSAAPSEVDLTLTRPVKRSLHANIARLQSGRLRGWIVAVRDETRRKRIEHQKVEFINIAAHELRTPLGAVLGYSELLRDSNDDANNLNADQKEYLDAILRGGQRLNNIVMEMVQFADLTQGDIRPHEIVEFVLSELIDSTVNELRQAASDKRIALKIDADPLIKMEADSAWLRSALYQLILNAINFTLPGGEIRIKAEEEQKQVILQVSDNGIGIPKPDLETIFRPFFQVESHDTRRVGGLGLGLSIARRAVTQLGGTISVDSTLNQGTTFTLELPTQQHSSNAAQLSAMQAELDSSQQQALVYARDMQRLYRQLQETNRSLQTINTQLDEANKLKANFLSVISHELRSPFASIELALQTFNRYGVEELRPEQRELLDQLAQNLKDGRRMIDSLVTYASLLSKQGRLNLGAVEIDQVIDETTAALRPLADRRRQSLVVQVSRGLTLPSGDRERIGEAVWHLLHNAIKFSNAEGQIVIRARTEGEYLAIEVKDTGVGIPLDKQAQVWESFAQLSDSVKRGVEGLGLGLSLVRYVALAHGGNVVLHSEPGIGSVIGFWLPVSRRYEGAA
jgi:PAS domain S-box-containing protein